jgi:hypothetical protein
MKHIKISEILAIAFFVGIFILAYVTREKDPAYWPQPATYYGQPAFTQLHRPSADGVQYITFYHADNAAPSDDFITGSKHWVIGHKICTMPTELAIEMYHARPGWPK